MIRLLPGGGGGWRMAAMIGVAVLAIAASVAAPYLAPVLVAGATATGGLGVALGAAAGAIVSIGGTLLVNHLLPPPIPQLSRNSGKEAPTYAIAGARNAAQPWSKVPFLLGRFKITPPYAAMPYREIIAGEVYWRALFALSHGPVQIEEMAIGATQLGNFQGVEIQFRRGYWSMTDRGAWSAAAGTFPDTPAFGDTWTCVAPGAAGGASFRAGQTITYNALAQPALASAWDVDQGKQLTLYPHDVHEQGLSVAIRYGTAQVRTSQVGGDELGIELIFERGLVHLQNVPAGKRSDASVTLRIEQSPKGSNAWAIVAEPRIAGRQTTPLYWGHVWTPGSYQAPNANRDWDVRITRLVADFDEERNFGNFSWMALRTITWGDPAPVPGVALIALRIKSSEQLSGVIDSFNLVCSSIARDYEAALGSWVWRPTGNPAALFRHVLQHPARERPAADSQIDLARLADWSNLCNAHWRHFNGVLEAKTSLHDALIQIGRVGRAMPTLRDLKFSVVIDEPRCAPVRLFSPANAWDYDGEMTHRPTPHAYRIGYVDRALEYRSEEVVVYDDGYGPANAVRIDKVEWPGICDRGQAYREGRYHLAQQRLRREVHHLTVDFEQLACERGDLVALQHDVIAVGLASGRVVAVTEAADRVLDVTLDVPVSMAGDQTYGLRARRVISGAQRTDLYRLVTQAGTAPRLTFAEPPLIAGAPRVGDLAAFGIWQRETLRLLIRDIEPRQDLSARLTLIAEAAGVHLAESGPVPPHDPMVTAPPRLPAPLVLAIASDARVMVVTPSRTLIDRVVFQVQPIAIDGARLLVIFRLTATAGDWQSATVQEETAGSVAIIGLQSGETYDFRLQYTHDSSLSGPVTAINAYYVVGRTAPPDDLRNLTIAAIGGQALLRWDLPADLDVQLGGWISFRHAPDMDAAIWPNSTALAQAVLGDQTHVYLPLKPGTYFARVYDADGRASPDAARVSTRQASVLAFAPVGEAVEDPLFTGARTRCHVVAGGLMLDADTFAGVPAVSALASWTATGGVVESGLYAFAAGIDLGSVRRTRVTSRIKLEAINEHDYWDAKIGPIDSWADVDGTTGAAVDAAVYGKLSDDDPAGTPAWGAFTRIDSAELQTRAIGQLECRLSTANRAFNLWLTELRVTAEEAS